MSNEVWVECFNYPDYEISNNGKVRRSDTQKERSLCLRNGYPYVGLTKNEKYRAEHVHRLMMMSFFGDHYLPGCEVNHKNGIKTDNKLENLEWVTHKQNMSHASTSGLLKDKSIHGESHHRAKLTKQDVLQIRQLCSSGHRQTEVAKMFGVASVTINHIMSGRNWKAA